jgi:hypothetical protein
VADSPWISKVKTLAIKPAVGFAILRNPFQPVRLLAEVNRGCEELQWGEGTIVTRESEFLNLARGVR